MSSLRSAARPGTARKPGVGTPLQSSEAISARLDDLERKIERLRALHESFFLGVERRPPHIPRQELNRLMLETQQVSIRNAAQRFRFQSLSQRWTLLTTYWNRTLREIESGTYRRDLQKAYRRLAERGQPLTEAEAATLGIPAGRAKSFVEQQNRRWGNAPHSPAGTTPGTAGPVNANQPSHTGASTTDATKQGPSAAVTPTDDVDLAAIHRAYVQAHSGLGLPGAAPTEDRVRAKVLPYLERLRAANPGTRLAVAVAVENARVVIRAKPVR